MPTKNTAIPTPSPDQLLAQAPNIEVAKIAIDYYKTISTTFMAVLGAEVTLTGTIFKDSDHLGLACIAMVFALLSVLGAMSNVEAYIRRLSPPPTIPFFYKMHTMMNGEKYEMFRQIITALLFSGSVVCYMGVAFSTLL